jgi:Holliday junction resolvase-like predicted endonuclease
MERLINRRQQGDLGEASAIEWLTRQGATVSVPLGHSPDYDLVAEFDGAVVRVQVKTTTQSERTREGSERWLASICTNGGNQSWTGVSKRFDSARIDALFVLVGNGRRWFIPAGAVEGTIAIRLGGTKYSEFEIEPGAAISGLVYARDEMTPHARLESKSRSGEYPSGQRGGAVNAMAHAFAGSNPASPILKLGRPGQTTVGRRRLMTMPHVPFTEAGLQIGDRLRFRADGRGRLVVERIEPAPPRQVALTSLVRNRH